MPPRRPRPLPKFAGLCAAAVAVVSFLHEPEVRTLVAQLLDLYGLAEYGPLAAKLLGVCSTLFVLFSHSLTGHGGKPEGTQSGASEPPAP